MSDIRRAVLLEFIKWAQEEYTNNHAEADASGMFSGSYWAGKADAFDEVLEYWDRVDSIECEHESDGMIYYSNPPQNKCLKCGEFYR